MRKEPLRIAGMDVLYTKIAVDFQNLTEDNWDETVDSCLLSLREASEADAVFLALMSDDDTKIEKIRQSASSQVECAPGYLIGRTVSKFPWLFGRLGHLRLTEILNTEHYPEEMGEECRALSAAHIGSVIMIGIFSRS